MSKVLVLFFGSGCTSLIYQVLWMRELELLFGNTAHAAAVTLTAFFIGLAVGGYAWGKYAEKLNNPLRTYGYLELGVSLAALGYFFLLPAYQHIYPFVFSNPSLSPPIKLSFHVNKLISINTIRWHYKF